MVSLSGLRSHGMVVADSLDKKAELYGYLNEIPKPGAGFLPSHSIIKVSHDHTSYRKKASG